MELKGNFDPGLFAGAGYPEYVVDQVRQLDGKIEAERLFNREFLRLHTDFDSYPDFKRSSPIELEGMEGLELVDSGPFNDFVAENTEFEDFDHMCRKAIADFINE